MLSTVAEVLAGPFFAARSATIRKDMEDSLRERQEAEAKAGAPIKVTGFVRFALGEGIERAAAH